jgi:hypothetical protein
MQLGTRWAIGAEPPARLPEAMVAAIREVESQLDTGDRRRWTLTWLERRPYVELDDGPRMRLDAAGSVIVEVDPDADGVEGEHDADGVEEE